MTVDPNQIVMVLAAVALMFLVGYAFVDRFFDDEVSGAEIWTLMLGVIILPSIALFAGFNSAMENSKSSQFCGTSCHVMQPYYEDLIDPESTNLAAVHYQNRYLRENQCYQCHTDYTMFGPLSSKVAGVKHVWNYYTGSWDEPIKLRGEYRISNCLVCHGEAKNYLDLHGDYLEELAGGEASCLDCHSDIHPVSQEARLSGHEAGR